MFVIYLFFSDTKATLVISEVSTLIDITNENAYISVGFRDNGSCTKVMSVRVFSRFCTNTTKAFATFRQTFALSDDQVVVGECVPNSDLAFSPKSTCTREGEWEDTTGGCKCRDGYTAVEDTACISKLLVFYYNINHGRRKIGHDLFNDALNTFRLRLYGVTHMVKDH